MKNIVQCCFPTVWPWILTKHHSFYFQIICRILSWQFKVTMETTTFYEEFTTTFPEYESDNVDKNDQNHIADDVDSNEREFDLAKFLLGFKISVGIIGALGNFIVCVILLQIKAQKIKLLIASQAIIDMITSITLVASSLSEVYHVPIPQNTVFGYLFCAFWVSGILTFVLFSISTFNLVAISIERYVAVLYPMQYRIDFTRKKALILGATCWVLAPTLQLIYGLPQWGYGNGRCKYYSVSASRLSITGMLLFLWEFFIPCVIMAFSFTRISLILRKHDLKAKSLQAHSVEINSVSRSVSQSGGDGESKEAGNPQNRATEEDTRRSRNVTKTFIIVFVVFLLCWLLNQTLFLQYNMGGYMHFGKPENHFANSMAILNSACNPIIYTLHLKQYREKLCSCFRSSLEKYRYKWYIYTGPGYSHIFKKVRPLYRICQYSFNMFKCETWTCGRNI